MPSSVSRNCWSSTSSTPSQARERRAHLARRKHLLSLINEVLDIARIEAGRLALHAGADRGRAASSPKRSNSSARSPAGTISRCIFDRQPRTSRRCNVLADRQRLQQVMLNLLSNAVKYNRAGGQVTVSYRSRRAAHPHDRRRHRPRHRDRTNSPGSSCPSSGSARNPPTSKAPASAWPFRAASSPPCTAN